MTREQWLQVKPGDFVIDRGLKSTPHRLVIAVKRWPPKRAGAMVRTWITVANVKSSGSTTQFANIVDGKAPGRFELVPVTLVAGTP